MVLASRYSLFRNRDCSSRSRYRLLAQNSSFSLPGVPGNLSILLRSNAPLLTVTPGSDESGENPGLRLRLHHKARRRLRAVFPLLVEVAVLIAIIAITCHRT